MNIIDKFHNWRRKLRWNKQYRNGRWDNLRKPIEAERYYTILKFINSHGKVNPSILDLGAGEGVLNEYLDDEMFSYFLGMDFSEVSIEKAKMRKFPKTEFITADIHTFTPSQKFDVIIFNEAFYYVHDSEKQHVLDRMLNHLNDDGILIVSIYREGIGCWEYFEKLQQLDYTIVKTEEEKTYWKIGAYKK
ncbi:class I SAM-dependent methyltransferase [Kordia sp.]|uniref:class I SAM-dependent methyltransferase n=1 Tax=Kordia sp. TaxID=1965332 RepID=UPI003D281705